VDSITIAIAALSPYLAKGTEAFAQSAGKEVAEMVGDLYRLVKSKFKGDSYAEQTLARMEEKPNDKGRQSVLKTILVDKTESDPEFAKNLHQISEELEKIDGASINMIASAERAIAAQNIQGSTIISGNGNVVNGRRLSDE